jgi:hypothetical protein
MTLWQGILWAAAGIGLLAGLYGLHRLALWLEDRGHLFYLRKQPTAGAGGCFTKCQEFVNPNVKIVFQAKEDKRKKQVDPGEQEPPEPDKPE